MTVSKPNVVIVGGGFSGLYAAQRLARNKINVTLIDRRNFHLFQPLLYQVATGFLAPGDIAAPIRSVLANKDSVNIVQDEVRDIDPSQKVVITPHTQISYDFLIVAAGVTHSYFGNEQWAQFAPGLKTIEDSVEIRGRVLRAFEAAEQAKDSHVRKKNLTFIIVGGGPTGVELAGALTELSHRSMKGEFRNFIPSSAKIILVEGGSRILATFHKNTSKYAERILKRLGVDVVTQTRVIAVGKDYVEVLDSSGKKTIQGDTILWAAGVKASPLSQVLQSKTGANLDKIGRVKVAPDLSLENFHDIFVIGDLANATGPSGSSLPGVAPVAIQQGQYVAGLIIDRINKRASKPFVYFDKGNMAVIGKGRAVAETGKLRLRGFPAWLAWAFIHIYFLIEFENKLVVFVHWAWNYITNARGSRLITETYKEDLGEQ
jgi:NADH dehydrogenase